MASYKKYDSADFINTDRNNYNSTSSGDISEQRNETDLVSKRKETSNEIGAASADNKSFNDEDNLITKLYKKVIDDLMSLTNKKFLVSDLNDEMQRLMKKGESKSKVKGDQKMDLSKSINLSKYLSVHGTCHTGLVKKAIWSFFQRRIRFIFNTYQLKVVSLGGGPGCDLVGFCNALQETRNYVEQINFKIIDSKEWMSEFKRILKTAKDSDFGSLSKLLKTTKINRHFVEADLNTKDIFRDETLSSVISEADFILMVKLDTTSNYCDKKLIEDVVDAMKVGCKFIFIYKLDNDLFNNISRLLIIYDAYEEYKMSYNPSECHKFSTSYDKAHIRVFLKM